MSKTLWKFAAGHSVGTGMMKYLLPAIFFALAEVLSCANVFYQFALNNFLVSLRGLKANYIYKGNLYIILTVCFLLISIGAYLMLRRKGYRPFKEILFYVTPFIGLIPLFGPIISFVLIGFMEVNKARNVDLDVDVVVDVQSGVNVLKKDNVSPYILLFVGIGFNFLGPNILMSPFFVAPILYVIMGFCFYKVLSNKGYAPFKCPSFYFATVSTIVPYVGPIIAFFVMISKNDAVKGRDVGGAAASAVFLSINYILIVLFMSSVAKSISPSCLNQVSVTSYFMEKLHRNYTRIAFQGCILYRSPKSTVAYDLKSYYSAEKKYHEKHGTYTDNLKALRSEGDSEGWFKIVSDRVIVNIELTGNNCFVITGRHCEMENSKAVMDCKGEIVWSDAIM